MTGIDDCVEEFKHHHGILKLVDKLTADDTELNDNRHLKQVKIKHEDAIYFLKSKFPELNSVNTQEIDLTKINAKAVNKFIALTEEIEQVRNQIDSTKCGFRLSELVNRYKSIQNNRKKMEAKTPFIRSLVKIYLTKQKSKLKNIINLYQ